MPATTTTPNGSTVPASSAANASLIIRDEPCTPRAIGIPLSRCSSMAKSIPARPNAEAATAEASSAAAPSASMTQDRIAALAAGRPTSSQFAESSFMPNPRTSPDGSATTAWL